MRKEKYDPRGPGFPLSRRQLCIACRGCIFRRTASPVTALLHDAGLTPVGKARLATVAEYFGQSLRLHAVPEPPPEIAAGLPPQFGPGSLYRLHLPRLLDEEQVIYLDCDVCCTLDIRELWEEATQEQSRCCPACAIRRPKARAGNSEKRPGPCALLQQRRTGLSSAPPARLVSGSHGRCPVRPLLYPDQDALNLLFRRLPLHWLGERFNYQLHVAGRWPLPPDQLEGSLLHFCGRKPWCEPLCPSALGHLEN